MIDIPNKLYSHENIACESMKVKHLKLRKSQENYQNYWKTHLKEQQPAD